MNLTLPRSIRIPRAFRRIPAFLALIAAIAVGLWYWTEVRTPGRAWLRAIRSRDLGARSDAWDRVKAGPIEGVSIDRTRSEVIAALGDPEASIRVAAMGAVRGLPALVNDPVEMLPRLLPMLHDAEFGVRHSASALMAQIIGSTGQGRGQVASALDKLAADPDPRLRAEFIQVAQVLIRSSRDPRDPLLDQLVRMLDDPDRGVADASVEALAWTDRGQLSLPYWERAMLDARRRGEVPGPGFLGPAGENLWRLAVRLHFDPALAFLLSEVYRPGQPIANPFLGGLRSAVAEDPVVAARAVVLATAALQGSDPDARLGSAIFLESIGQVAPARAAWLESLRHPDPRVRALAIEALATQGPGSEDVAAPLRALGAGDPDPGVRRDAAAALAIVAP